MDKKLLRILTILTFLSSLAYGQTRTISGKVIGKDDGLPLPGVSIRVVGAQTGTQTGSDGSYTIKVAPGKSLSFSSLGYDSKTMTPSSTQLDVVLSGSSNVLNDVVVVGYGTQLRRDNIGSTGSIKGTELATQPVQNIQQSLGGRISGAQVSIPSGLLNATPVIRIRGTNSISYNSQPLYVVDGVPVYSGNENGGTAASASPLSSINPEDVESVDIAKDAAATAIYGSRAANGVVFITTKKGKKGKAVVSLDSWTGISKNFNLPQMLNATQYTDIKNEGLRNSGTYNDNTATPAANLFYSTYNDASGNLVNTNWLDYIYRTGTSYNTSASVSGANDFTNYYLSANWTSQQGLLVGNDFKRKGLLANIDHKVSKYVTVGAKISYSNSQNYAATGSGSAGTDAFSITGLGRIGLVLPPNVSPYNANGTYNMNGNTLGIGANKGIGIGYYNIMPLLDLNRSNNELNQINSNVYLSVKPLPGLTLKTQYGIDYLFRDIDVYQNPLQGDGSPNASATSAFAKNKSWVWDNTLQYDRTFGAHSLSVLLGNEQNALLTRGFGINRTVISDPAFDVVQAGFSTNNPSGMLYTDSYIASFFGRLNYDFKKKYYLSATIRQDEASQFGNDNKRGYFPGGAIAWEVAREEFWKAINADKIFSSFKLRASYGKVGNNSLGAYDSYGLYANGLYNGAGTLYFNQTGNPGLQWENIKTLDLGANLGFLNNRITVEATYYKKNIDDLILQVPVAPSSGLPSRPSVNIGSMFNRGFEFLINADAVHTSSFSWAPSFNISFNHNEVTALAEGVTRLTTATSGSETTNITEVGHPIGNLYIVRTNGVDPATGRRIFLDKSGREVLYQNVIPRINGVPTGFQWEYTDGTRAPAITQSADAVNYKQTAPKFYGGFSNTFTFKGLDLNVLLTYQAGGSTYYGTNAGLRDQRFWNNSVDILNRWTTPGQITDIPKVYQNDNVSNGSSMPISANVFSSDFIKVKSLSFGYTLPKTFVNQLGLANLRFYVSGYNLLTFTKYPGPDPEVSSNGASSNTAQGVDRNTAGNQRTMTAGLSVKF